MPDDLIVAKEGADNAPSYRGLAYVVFERLPLADFSNRIPQLSFEIVRPVGQLERMARAVTLIPGSTEFGYETSAMVRVLGPGQSAPENRHVTIAASDVMASLDDLQATCPNLERVAIVVAWFGSDLRAGECKIRPGVERTPLASVWMVTVATAPGTNWRRSVGISAAMRVSGGSWMTASAVQAGLVPCGSARPWQMPSAMPLP